MSDSKLSAEHKRRLLLGAMAGTLPNNIPCRNQCSFCFEASVSKQFPWVRKTCIPRYTNEAFGFYRKAVAVRRGFADSGHVATRGDQQLDSPFHMDGGLIRYHGTCDFFSMGLSHEQIEEAIRLGIQPRPAYTTGLDADPDFLEYLSREYRDTFRVWLSIVTFDEEIRRRTMHRDCTVARVRDLCPRLYKPTFALLIFNSRQIIEDVNEVHDLAVQTRGRVYVSKLYFSDASPQHVAEYARQGEKEIETAVLELAERKWKAEGPLLLSPGGDVYSFRWRLEIEQLLSTCSGMPEEVVFCSLGAFQTIRQCLRDRDTKVVPVGSCFGGNTDMAHGMTIRGIQHELNSMTRRGMAVRRILVPSAMFPVSGKYDINGDSIETLNEARPETDAVVVAVPSEIINSSLTLSQCVEYYRRHGRSKADHADGDS